MEVRNKILGCTNWHTNCITIRDYMFILYVVFFFFIYLAWIRRNDKGPGF